jgi:hypothetical protein
MRSRTAPAHFALAALIAASPSAARAQSPDWNAFLAVRPDPSPYIADWETDPSVVTLVLSYSGSAGVTFHLTGTIRRGAAVILAGRSTTFEFVRPSQLLLTTRDGIWEPNSVTYDPGLSDQLERTGRISDGEYQFCVEVREGLSEAAGALLTQACADFSITAPAPPSLVAPGDGDTVFTPLPTLVWTPVMAGPNAGVTYHVRLAEVLPNQSPLEAISNNAPHVEADLSLSMFAYPQTELPLRDSSLYVWQVQALDAAGQPFGERQGKSEVWTFTMGGWLGVHQPIAGRLPDTLTLIPGVARLRGLRGVDGAESATAYTLNGMVSLDVLTPFVARATVALEDLAIEKSWLLSLMDGAIPQDVPAELVSGRITGRLDTLAGAGDGPSLVRFREVEYTPGAGLAFGGELLLPGRPGVPFQGRVRVTDGGLVGTLTAEAVEAVPLFSVGGDPVRLDVRRVETTFPSGVLRLGGALALFDQNVGCEGVSGTADANGNLSADVTCTPLTPMALVPGIEHLRVALNAVAGSLEADLMRAELGEYQLAVGGEVRLTRSGADLGCGAAFQLAVANGGVAADGESFRSRCDGSREATDLEWLGVRITNLRLERLAYDPERGFDARLLLDLEPQVSSVSAFALPTIAGVEVDSDGLVIPAIEVEREGARVDLLGFGFRVTRYRLPAFTLAWSDWQGGFPGGFRFELGAELMLPDLATGPSSCRTADPIVLDGATLADGRLSATVPDHAFDPACGLTFSPDFRLDIDRVSGAFGVRLSPDVALEQSPEVAASLILPRLFACSDSTARRLALPGARLRVGSRGRVTGTVTDLAPACPMDLAAAQVTVNRASLVFSEENGNQVVLLSGDAEAVLKLAATPTRGTGTAAVDLMHARLISGRLDFPGPFRLDLPREQPVLSFEIAQAGLDSAGLRLDGRNRLLLSDGQSINTTFDQLTMDPANLAITAGQAVFDVPFALEVGIDLGGDLRWRAVPTGQGLGVSAGVRADLPSHVALGSSGLVASGDGRARLVYGGRDMDALRVVLSQDFAVGLDPAGVRSGQADFLLDGDRVAFLNQAGFQPDLDFFTDALIPAQLPLPTVAVAFAGLRDQDGELLVRAENTDAGIRVFTPSGRSVPLVVPALQRGDTVPPSVQASFDVTLDPLGRGVSAGTIRVNIPAGQQSDFRLSPAGPPVVRVTDLEYSAADGLTLGGELMLPNAAAARLTGRARVTALGIFGTLTADAASGTALLTLGEDPVRVRVTRASLDLPGTVVDIAGSLDLFRQELGCEGVSGTLSGDSLSASISCVPERPVALVPDVDRLRLTLAAINGSALLDVAAGRMLSHRLVAAGALHLDATRLAGTDSAGATTEPAECGATLELTVADGLVSVNPETFRARCDAAEGDADMGWLELRLSNIALERMEYRAGSGFDFALRLDADPSVPAVPELDLPALLGVVIGTDGIGVSEVDAPLTAGLIDVAGFGVRLTRVRVPAFTLGWRDWQARAPEGFRFSFEGDVTLPQLDSGSPSCLDSQPIVLSVAELAAGRVTFSLVERTYIPVCVLPLAPDVAFEVERLGGSVAVRFAPQVVLEQGPEVEGALSLPGFFACPDATLPRRLSLAGNRLRISSGGRITGTVTGLAPPCAIDLAALQVAISDASLQFAAQADSQSVVLSGAAAGSFTLAGNPVRGTGQMVVDLVRGRMLSGSLRFPGPFRFDLPRERPVLSFVIDEANLDTAGLHIEGRQRLVLADGQTVNVTFDNVTINPLDLALAAGAVRFSSSFAFEVAIAEDGSLGWKAVPRNAPLSVETGIRVDLPAEIALTASGFTSVGEGAARLLFQGRDVDSLSARFSDDFAIALQPFGVAAGQVDFLLGGESIAYLDPAGFRPNFAYFAEALLPARFGLPTVDVAYLQLRDQAGNLLVRSENTGSGIRLSTPPNSTVPLVLPSLQLGRPEAPRVNVAFDVVLDPLGRGLSAGTIRAAVPAEQRAAFDLSSGGLPVRIDTVSYEGNESSAYRFTLGGNLALFGDSGISGGEVLLTLDGTGHLVGDVLVEIAQRVPLVAGDGRLALSLSRAEGAFDAGLVSGTLTYDLDLHGAVELTVNAVQAHSVEATVHVSETGVSVTRIEADQGETPAFLDGGPVRLGLTNLRVPRLDYAYQTGVWEFELLFDAQLAFPELDSLVLPPMRDVTLRRNGFSLPAYSVPELAVDTFTLAGFVVRPLAFRMTPFGFNWFTGELWSDPGFAFDLELAFPADAPVELRGTRLSVLNAGYRRGGFTGAIEPRNLPSVIRLPLGGNGLALDLQNLGGALAQDSADRQDISVTTSGALVLPDYMRCDAEPDSTVPLPGAMITLSSTGHVAGSASQVLPRCPARVGPLTLQVASSELRFDIGADQRQRAELFTNATAHFPAPAAGDTVAATGEIGLDLVTGRVTRGFIELNAPFRWHVPWSGDISEGLPLFTFIVNQARIDQEGLHLTGSGQAEFYDWELVDVGSLGQAGAIAEGAAEVTFADLTLGLPDFSITSGSVGFTQSFALDAGFEQNKPRWRSAEPSKPRKDGPGLRVTMPQNVSLSRDGLSIGGTAVAELAFGDTALAQLDVIFADDFLFGYDPVGVARGRATFRLQNTDVAYVDPTGFWPGDILGVLPVPARIGLPSETIAYLELRDANGQLLVESRNRDNGVSLRTRSGQAVRLVVPALAGEAGETASVNVQFDVLVNAATYQPTSGSIRATAPDGGAPLFALDNRGLPLEVREVAYEPAASGYGLRLDARLRLPAALGGVDVLFNDLLVDETGISGTAETGRYTEAFDPELPPLASKQLAENVILDVLGARGTFGGDSADIRLSGVVRTPLFSPPQGGPVAIFFAGGLGSAGLALTVDPLSLPEGRLPIGLVTFEPQAIGNEPPIRITATDEEFSVRLSGVLRAPSLSPEFAATIQGLEVGTRGIVLPTVSLARPEEEQRFRLFGASFTLKDSVGGYPAIALDYSGGVFAVTMTGEMVFLDHATRFYGLRVSSEGAVTLAAASLLSEPVVLAENLLTLDSLTIREARLRADLGVTLPAPLAEGGTQRVYFSVAPDGTVEGGGTVVVRDEAPGLGGERTQFTVGIATLHPRYVGVTLDLGGLDRSALEVVADVYVRGSEDNRIKLGDVTGGTVSPGLRVGFDGSVAWGNVALAREFDFDFEAVRLTLAQVAAVGDDHRFAVSLSGQLGLNIAAVSGSLDFTDFRIDDRGEMAFSPSGIKGGEFSIAGVVNLQVEGFAYSNTATTIEVAGGSMPSASAPAAAGVETVDVSSYVRFGGRIDVVDVLAGGVEEVLVYQTAADGRTAMIVRGATLDVYDVVTMQADLRYREIAGGFEMVLGAEGKLLQQYDVTLVGAIEQGNGTNRMGMFLSTGVTIPIPAVPVVVISELGGGFFYNPKPEYLDLVRQYAGVSQTAGEKIEAPVGRFAGLLYGAARITPAGVAEGRVLLTVMPTALQVDGAVTILSQGNRLRGDAHLVLGLKKSYAEGNIAFTVDYDPVLNGAGQMQFYVYGPEVWGITGATDASVVNYFEGTSELFIGPPGFIISVGVEQNFDIWILEINSDFDLTAWYQRSASEWGAHAAIRAKAELLDGTISASGTLQSALLFPSGGTPLIYAAGKVEGCVVGQCADKRVWVKFKDGKVDDYGTGRNSELEDLLDEAQDVAEEIVAAQEEAQDAAEQAQLAALGISYQELAAAYQRIQGWSQQQFDWVAQQSTGIEQQYAPQRGEGAQFDWYLGLLRQEGAPADTALIRSYGDSVDATLARIEGRRGAVNRRIAEISAGFQAMEPAADVALPGSPVSQLSFSAPVTRTQIDASGDTAKVLESGPGFAVDAEAARQTRSALDEWRLAAERADQEIRAQLQAMESTLREIRAVTTGTDEASLLSYARLHGQALSAAERQYAAQADHILRKQDWMRASLAAQGAPVYQADLLAAVISSGSTGATRQTTTAAPDPGQTTAYGSQNVYALVNRYTAITSIIRNKTQVLRAESFSRLRTLIIFREALLDLWLGTNGARVAAFVQAEAGKDSTDAFYDQWADSTGMWIWYHLARAGMEDANREADAALADLAATAGERLGAIRTKHGAISASLDRLYRSQAALTGVLHDIYDQYLLWRTEDSLAGAPDLASFVARQQELEQELTVPRLTGVQVTSVNAGYFATQTFQWSGTHPRGTYEFLFRDAAQADAGLGTDLYSNGPEGLLTGHRFLPQRGWTEPGRSLEVGVRGGAGFVGLGRADYQVTFQEQGGGTGASMTYVALTDVTPPSRPVVEFVGSPARPAADGGSDAWTTRSDEITVRWSAGDGESGIAEYQYAVGRAPGDTTIRPWQSAGGRPEISLDVRVSQLTPLHVSVRARNGQNLWGEVGVSPALRLDPSPPAFPAGAAIAAGEMPDGAASPLRTVSLAACPVPEPEYPSTPRTVDRDRTTSSTGWDGALSRGTGGNGSGDRAAGTTASGASRVAPRRSFNWPAADDPESGLIAYYWRADTIPIDSFTAAGWNATPGSQPAVTVTGAPLDYDRQLYVSVVAVNYAGLATEPLMVGPFRIPDPTRPGNPAFCAGLGSATDRLLINLTDLARDPETRVRGYQYRVRTATAIVRDWAGDSLDWSEVTPDVAVATEPVALSDGQGYFVEVRAVNGHGLYSDTVTSGPTYFDASPPPTPTATVQIDTRNLSVLPLRITGAADPQSGFMTQHLAVGTTNRSADVVAWRNVPGAAPGEYTVEIPLEAPLARGTTYWVQIRTVNLAGLASPTYAAAFTVPAATVPVRGRDDE